MLKFPKICKLIHIYMLLVLKSETNIFIFSPTKIKFYMNLVA